MKSTSVEKPVQDLLGQALETEIGGAAVYRMAVLCAQHDELKEEWHTYRLAKASFLPLDSSLLQAQGAYAARRPDERPKKKHPAANGDGSDPGPIERLQYPASPSPKADDLAHFQEDPAGKTLTTNQGVPVQDDQHSLRAGERGPSLLEDFHFREKITHFDHERIPERVVHARGSGAHG